MPIDVRCDGCGAEFTTNDEFSGQQAQCPDCGHDMVIPTPEQAAAATAVATAPAPPPPPTPPAPTPGPMAPAAAPSEFPPGKAQVPQAAAGAPVAPAGVATVETTPSRTGRARMVEYFRIALAIAIALTVVKLFEAGAGIIQNRAPVTPAGLLQDAWGGVKGFAAAATKAPAMAPLSQRGASMETTAALPMFLLLFAMALMALRLLVRTKMLDAIFVSSPHWQKRTLAGVTFHFLTTLALVGILAWSAALMKVPNASDGAVCGLLAVWLGCSCLAALAAHLSSGREFPHVTGRMLNDMVFGGAILAVFCFGGAIPAPMSRVSVTALLVLLNSAIDFTVSSGFILDSDRASKFSRRVGFMAVSIVLVGALGWLLAVHGI